MSDNYSVMKGRQSVYNSGETTICYEHVLYLSSGKYLLWCSCKNTTNESRRFDHWHLQLFQTEFKTKRGILRVLEFQDVDPLKIHVSTRWLSLHKCVTRTIYRWPALLSYFNSHKDGDEDGRVRRVADQLESPEMKMYFQFLEFILAPFSEFNTVFKVSLINLINYQSKKFEDLHFMTIKWIYSYYLFRLLLHELAIWGKQYPGFKGSSWEKSWKHLLLLPTLI